MGILARTLAEFPLVGKALAGSAGRSLPAAQLGYMAYGATQWSRQMNLRAYGEVGWLFVCIHRIASSVASATWHLYRRTGTDPDQREEIPRHPLLDLMRAPNPYSRRQTWHEFVMLTQAFKELTGEAAWWVGQRGGRPVELICVNPVYIDVVPDLAHFIRGFVYSANGAARIPLERDAVVWMASPNPTNEYRGLGPVTPIMPDLEAERYAVLYNRNFFLNNAEPDGIISIPGTVSPQGFQRISDQWNEKHRGVQNAHRIGLLEGDAKYTPTQFTNRDMQFDRLRQVNRQSILGAFGMPPSIVGITEAVNRSNADTAEYTYARWVIVPRLRELRDKVNQQLVPMFGDDTLELDFDDPTPADNQAQATLAELLYRGNLATRNEGRALVDLPPDETEAGDRYAFEDPIGSAPGLGDGGPLGEIDQIGAAGEDNPKAESEPAGATRRGATKGMGEDAGSSGGALVDRPKDPEDAGLPVWKAWDDRLRRRESPFADALRAFFHEQERDILGRLESKMPISVTEGIGTAEDEDLDEDGEDNDPSADAGPRPFAPHRAKFINPADWWDAALWERKLRELGLRFAAMFLKQEAEHAHAAFHLGIRFDLNNPRVRRWLGERLRRFSTQVNETTKRAITAQLQAGEVAGEGIYDLQQRVKAVFHEATTARAEVIARTETVSASNMGALEAYRQAGVREKRWLATRDTRTRDAHREADGQTVPMEGMFAVGGELLDAPGQGRIAANNIQCRCALLPVIAPAKSWNARCPACNKLLAEGVAEARRRRCPRCKREAEC